MSFPGANEHYPSLVNGEIDERIKDFDILYTQYCNDIMGDGYLSTAHYVRDEVAAIFRRSEMRKYYYRVFHGMDKGTNEPKMAALMVFWMLKYRPLRAEFRPKTQEERVLGSDVARAYDNACLYFTERFCVHILKGLFYAFHGKSLPASDAYIDDFTLNLRNADISKEAMIMLFEALIPIPVAV